MNKKIIIIIAVVMLAIIGLGVFMFVGRKNNNKDISNIETTGFFPDSGSGNINTLPLGSLGEGNLSNGKESVLTQLSSSAVSGAAYVNGWVIYSDKATGNIYNINSDGTERNRISNTTIPKIFEARFSYTGDNFIFRYLTTDDKTESVRNFLAGLSGQNGTSTDPSVEGIFLSPDISSVVISPEENKLFYTYKQGEQTIGVTANFQDKNKKQIFSSPFGSWNVSWPSKNIITLLTKPSGIADGFFYSLDARNGAFKKILGNIKGLGAVMDSRGENVIYSEAGQGAVKTRIYNLKKNEDSELQLLTLAEKCIFSSDSQYAYCAAPIGLPTALYPDEWYQGVVFFSDLIWRLNLNDGNTELLSDTSGNFDVINPFLSSNEDYLFFINKKDGSLWSLKLREES